MNLLELFLPTLIRRSVRQVIAPCRSLLSVPALTLLAAAISTTSNAELVESIIPLGSYLEHFNIGRIFYKQGEMFFNNLPFGPKDIKLSFEATDNIPNPGACWSQGYDLAKGSCTKLSCDTTTQRAPDGVSRFLYSAPMPYGSYLKNCTGIIRTLENNRYYLYAACLKAGWGPSPSDFYYQKNRLDITDCQNDISSDGAGILSCTDAPVQPKQILSGSYLSFCNLSDTNYYPEHVLFQDIIRFDDLESFCGPGQELFRMITTNCMGSGKDITFIVDSPSPLQERPSFTEADNCPENGSSSPRFKPPSLEFTIDFRKGPRCKEDPTKEVKLHTASQYIPTGSYLLTCRKMAFYPCMGSDRQGVLAAQCMDDQGRFRETQLAYGESECRMSKPGYVSNINGQLHCDPDSPFDNEDTTQGADLLPHFQCNEDDGASPVPTVTPLNSTAND